MNILLVTSQFPNYDCPELTYATPFLYNYAKEWIEQGHTVNIIHLMRVYPKAFDLIAKLSSKVGLHALEKYIIDSKAQNEKKYTYGNIEIFRILYKKSVPHGNTSKYQIDILINKIKDYMCEMKIAPDLVIGDFFDPTLRVISGIKESLHCDIGQIMHVTDFPMIEQKKIQKVLPIVNFWLLRSKSQEEILKKHVKNYKSYIMPSGIDEFRVNCEPNYRENAKKLLFVGVLKKEKGIDTLLDALANVKKLGYTLTLVGDGNDKEYFRRRVHELDISDIVSFEGKVQHDDVFEYMKRSDVLVMISHETFGMVYVEAMSQGCIPVGAEKEGIDGVVINGQNGFLVPLGDSKTLSEILIKLSSETTENISELSKNAYNTAHNMTHSQLAEKILEKINRKSTSM